MTIDNTEFKLLRKPRKPKLDKIDLTRVHYPDQEDDYLNSSESESYSAISSDRELIASTSSISIKSGSAKMAFPSLVAQKSNRDKLVVILEEPSKMQRMPKNSLHTICTSSTSSLNDSSKMDNRFYNELMINRYKPNMNTIKSATFTDQTRKISMASAHTAKSVIKPYKVPGPDPLPARPIKFRISDLVNKKAFYENLSYDNTDLYENQEDDFDFNDFLLRQNNYDKAIVDYCFDKVFVSTHNYIKICKLLAQKIEQEKSANANRVLKNIF